MTRNVAEAAVCKALPRYEDDPMDTIEVLVLREVLEMPLGITPKAKGQHPKPPTRTQVWGVDGTHLGYIETPPVATGATPRAWTPSGSRLTHRTLREAIRSLVWDYENRTGNAYPRVEDIAAEA